MTKIIERYLEIKNSNVANKTDSLIKDCFKYVIFKIKPSLLKTAAKDGGVQAVTGCVNRCRDVMHIMHDREIFYNKTVFGINFLLFNILLKNPLTTRLPYCCSLVYRHPWRL